MELYRRLLTFLKPYWIKLAIAMACMSIVSTQSPILAYIVKYVIDDVLVKKNVTMLRLIPIGVIFLFFGTGLFYYLQAYFMGYVGQRVVTDIRNLVFTNLQKQPLSFFDKTPTGQSISRIMNDVTLVQGTVSDSITAILVDVFKIIGLIGVVFYRDWKLASVSFIVLPFAIYPIVSFGKKLRKVGLSTQKSAARLTSFLHETITGQRIVKAFSMETYENKRFEGENEEMFRIIMKRTKLRALSHPIMDIIGGIAIAVVIWYGGVEAIAGRLTPGDFLSFTMALGLLYEPIKRLNKENHNVQQGLAAAQRVFEIIDRKPEIEDKPGAVELEKVEGVIEFKNAYFKYDEKMVLKNINLRIEKNEVIALVGESGVGKTTLANLIPRFYDISEGQLEIDGVDVRNTTLTSLRKNIALVTQDVILFNDSIKNNIAYGVTPDQKKLEHAAAMAFAHEFIIKFPKGYDTIVGEKGVRLSGGQKQRIAIARALYKDAPVLILDEATSSLDAVSEIEVQRALENLMKGRTTIIIAHRLSTIVNANRIIVLEKGMTVQEGTHSSLSAVDGPYKKLYELQFKESPQKIVKIGRIQ
jgi:ATP-binding cassette, subfamily B, bacterial MsbA